MTFMDQPEIQRSVTRWSQGQYLNAVIDLIDNLPIIFCPFGKTWYYNDIARFGQETWWAPHNWVRQPFHLLGGLVLGAMFSSLNHKFVSSTLLGFFIYLEFFKGIPEGKEWQKALFDTLFWIAGVECSLRIIGG